MLHRDAEAGKAQAEQIDRDRPAQRHEGDCDPGRNPDCPEILMSHAHPEEGKPANSQRRPRIPECLNRFLSTVRDGAERLKVRDDQTRRDRR